jgi:pimeloyl-ACP methyl ester carboxylesterase
MKQPIHILYMSGLGDNYDRFRLRALKLWHFRGVTVELVPMTWHSGTFEQKLARIDQAIDRVKHKKVVLIGESGGGTMAIHMMARRDDIYKVMTLCGKNTRPEGVGEAYTRSNPPFRVSLDHLNDSLAQLTADQKKQFVSIHPLYDPIVPIRDTLLDGCKQVRLPAIGHLIVIALALTIFSPMLVRAAKSHR